MGYRALNWWSDLSVYLTSVVLRPTLFVLLFAMLGRFANNPEAAERYLIGMAAVAGKTTTVRILSTLLSPTSGTARVMGFDVQRQTREVRKLIGLILGGERGLYNRLIAAQDVRAFLPTLKAQGKTGAAHDPLHVRGRRPL